MVTAGTGAGDLVLLIRLQRLVMASSLSGCVGGWFVMVLVRCCIALMMQSALLMVGVGNEWWRNVKVSARRTSPVSATALMQR